MANNEYYTTGIPQMIISQPEAHPGKKYASVYKRLGITQFVLGLVSVVLGIAIIIVWKQLPYYSFCWEYTGSAILTGSWMFTAGLLGILAGNNPNNCLINGGLVVTIFAAIFASFMLAMEALGVYVAAYDLRYYNSYYYPYVNKATLVTHLTLHAILLAVAVVELIVAIVHSAYCCAGTCCKPRAVGPNPMAQNRYSFGGPTVYSSGQALGIGVQNQQNPNQWPSLNPAHAPQQQNNLPNRMTPYPALS